MFNIDIYKEKVRPTLVGNFKIVQVEDNLTRYVNIGFDPSFGAYNQLNVRELLEANINQKVKDTE